MPFPFLCRHSIAFFFPLLRLLIVFNLRASNGRSHYYLECIILQLKEINGQKNQLFRLGWRNSMKKNEARITAYISGPDQLSSGKE